MMRIVFLAALLTATTTGGESRIEPIHEQAVRYPDGRIASHGFFVGDRKVGLHRTWWPNGTLRSSATYADEAYDGEYRTWRINGHPYELRHYVNGRESGTQQSWNDDGTLYLNYEVVDGRRYGLVNPAPCVPTDAQGLVEDVESVAVT